MSSKMKLPSEATQHLDYLSTHLNMKRFIICRMALGYSLGIDCPPDFDDDCTGQEFNKSTILGNEETIINALVTSHFGKRIPSDELFSTYIRAEIIRGIGMLYREYVSVNSPTQLIEDICRRNGSHGVDVSTIDG